MASAEAPPGAQPATAAASPSAAATEGEALPELPLFACKEAYVYRVPPATTVGHRAELWDVNNWLATVSLRVVQRDDDATVRLLEGTTGELFAECPVPVDKPLATAVEPVIDSSRYFVLRIVDAESARHAFIGIGFRERGEASDFNAALHEFLQYIKRKRTADAMRTAYEQRQQSAAEAGAASPADAAPLADLSIREGETLRLKIAAPRASPGSAGGFVSRAAARGAVGALGKSFSLIMDGHGGAVAALSPPPRGASPRLEMSVSPALEAGGGSPLATSAGGGPHAPPGLGRLSGTGDAELRQRLQGLHVAAEGEGASCGASAASSSTAALPLEDDDFGDFEEAPPSPAVEQQVAAARPAATAAKEGEVAG